MHLGIIRVNSIMDMRRTNSGWDVWRKNKQEPVTVSLFRGYMLNARLLLKDIRLIDEQAAYLKNSGEDPMVIRGIKQDMKIELLERLKVSETSTRNTLEFYAFNKLVSLVVGLAGLTVGYFATKFIAPLSDIAQKGGKYFIALGVLFAAQRIYSFIKVNKTINMLGDIVREFRERLGPPD